jgi:hypothetical protein
MDICTREPFAWLSILTPGTRRNASSTAAERGKVLSTPEPTMEVLPVFCISDTGILPAVRITASSLITFVVSLTSGWLKREVPEHNMNNKVHQFIREFIFMILAINECK